MSKRWSEKHRVHVRREWKCRAPGPKAMNLVNRADNPGDVHPAPPREPPTYLKGDNRIQVTLVPEKK